MKHSFYRMILLISFCLLVCSFAALAQVKVQWDNTLGGEGQEVLHNIIAATDGGYLLAGSSSSPVSGDKSEDSNRFLDYWIVKTDKNGEKQWDKTLGGSGSDELIDVIATADGGYLLAGWSQSNASGDKSEDRIGGSDYWIVKIDQSGNKQWDKTIGGSDRDELTDVVATEDGGFLLAGSSESDPSGDKSENNKGIIDYWIVKVDKDGNKQWDKTLGGIRGDLLESIIATEDGGFLLAGSSDSPVSGDKSEAIKGSHDYWIIKTDRNGEKQWDKTFGGNSNDWLESIIATPDGGYLLGGFSHSNASGDKSENSRGNSDYWIVKTDESGNKQWDKTYGGNALDHLNSITTSPDGGYLLAGYSFSTASGDKSERKKGVEDFWIIKIDEHGEKQWDKTLGGSSSEVLTSALTTADGGYLLAGISVSNASGDKSEDSKGGNDYWIIKVVEVEEVFSIRSLSLVNADTDKVLFSLQDGAVINLSDLGNPHLTIQANTTPINVESVKLELTGPISHTQTENNWPYALFGDDPKAGGGRDYIGKAWKAGEYRLTATPYLAGKAGNAHRLSFSIIDDVSASVSYFVLVNADTDQDIRILRDGDVVDLSALGNPQLSIRANTKPLDVDRVELALSGPFSHTKTENHWPYALFGDHSNGPRDYIGRQWQSGDYTLTATPYLNNQQGITTTVSFSVTDNNSNARLAVEVYPVPTTGEITITHEGTAEEAQMMLLDFSGQPLLTQPLKGKIQLDLSAYRKGIYYLKVVDQQGMHLKRVVVE